MDEQNRQTELARAIEAYKAWALEQHRDNPPLAERMSASFARFAQWASEKIAEDPNARFAIVESQSLAAHERPTQQHYKELEAQGYNVVNLTAEKGVDFARQHFMPNAFEAGPDYLADRAKQEELLRVRAEQDNDAFCEKLYPAFAKEQALAMVPGAEKYVEFLGSRLEVIGGDVSSGTAALLHEKYGEQLGFKRFAIDNGLGPGYEEYPEQTNRALNAARRELNMPEQPVEGISATCSGEGGVLTPFAPGVLYKNGGRDLNLQGFRYIDPVRVGDARIEETGVFPGKGKRPIFYATGTSSGGQSGVIAPLLYDQNIARIRGWHRVAMERGAQVLIPVGKGKLDEFAHLADVPGITVCTDPATPGFQGTGAGVTIVEFGPQIPAYREISESIRDGVGGGVESHGGAGTLKELTSARLAAAMEAMGFPTFADQQYNIRALAERGVLLEVQGDTVEEWEQSIYDNAIEMLDNPGARRDAILQLREELDSQPPLGAVYRGFLEGPSDGPGGVPENGPQPQPQTGPAGEEFATSAPDERNQLVIDDAGELRQAPAGNQEPRQEPPTGTEVGTTAHPASRPEEDVAAPEAGDDPDGPGEGDAGPSAPVSGPRPKPLSTPSGGGAAPAPEHAEPSGPEKGQLGSPQSGAGTDRPVEEPTSTASVAESAPSEQKAPVSEAATSSPSRIAMRRTANGGGAGLPRPRTEHDAARPARPTQHGTAGEPAMPASPSADRPSRRRGPTSRTNR